MSVALLTIPAASNMTHAFKSTGEEGRRHSDYIEMREDFKEGCFCTSSSESSG